MKSLLKTKVLLPTKLEFEQVSLLQNNISRQDLGLLPGLASAQD